MSDYRAHFDKLKNRSNKSSGAVRPQASSVRKKKSRLQSQTDWKVSAGILVAMVGLVGVWMLLDEDDFGTAIAGLRIGWSSRSIAADPAQPAKANSASSAAVAKSAATKEQRTDDQREAWNAEELKHFSKLNERKADLDAREKQLDELEEELQRQRGEVERRIAELERTRQQIARDLEARVQTDDDKVATLVDMYSNMKPGQAAEVMSNLNEDLAVEILGRMKKKSAADILNLLKPDKARVLSERFAGFNQ